MGLAPDVFWSMTPRQFGHLVDRHKQRQRAEDRRAGVVAAMIYNAHRNPKKDAKGWTWLDVFPEHRPPKVVQTDDQMFEAMKLWTAATNRK